MTSQPSDLGRKVNQLSGDVEFLVGHIDDVERRLSRRITDLRRETRQRFDGVDQRFDGVDQRFDGIDQRFDGIEATLAEVLRRLPERPA